MHLSELSHPNELHGLSTSELEEVARQIREKHSKPCPPVVVTWAQALVWWSSPWRLSNP